jgi:hypothetical protein
MHSDNQFGHQSAAGNVPPLGSASGNMQEDDGRMQGITTAFQDSGKHDDENVTKVVARTSEHGDMLCSNLNPHMSIQVRGDTQQPLGNKKLGNSSGTFDDVFQDLGLDTVVGPYEPMSQPNPKRVRMFNAHARPERVVTTDETQLRKTRSQKTYFIPKFSPLGLGVVHFLILKPNLLMRQVYTRGSRNRTTFYKMEPLRHATIPRRAIQSIHQLRQ